MLHRVECSLNSCVYIIKSSALSITLLIGFNIAKLLSKRFIVNNKGNLLLNTSKLAISRKVNRLTLFATIFFGRNIGTR